MGLSRYIARKLQLTETKQRIVENIFWAVLGKMVQLLSGLLVGVIVARYLGPENYGLMNYVISLVVLFQTFSIFGLDSIEIREEARSGQDFRTVIGTAFGLKVFFAILFMGLVILTSRLMDSDGYTTLLVVIYSFTIVLNSFGVIRNYFFAIVQNKYVVKAEIVRTLFGIGIKVLLLALNVNLTWLLVAYTFDGVLLSSGFIVAYTKKVGSIRQWHFDATYARFLLKESFPLLLTSAAVIVYQRIDQVMIGQMLDKQAVGYFSVASRFVEILIFIPMMLVQTITPILVRTREKSQEEYAVKAQMFMNVSVWLSLLSSAIVAVVAYWLVQLTFGPAYWPAVIILQVMAFKAASVALSNTAGAMLVTEGLQRYAIFRDALGCVACIVLNYLLLPRFGVIAAAFVAIASNVAAGYLADAIIPSYRHLFVRQTKAIFLGWRDLSSITQLIRK